MGNIGAGNEQPVQGVGGSGRPAVRSRAGSGADACAEHPDGTGREGRTDRVSSERTINLTEENRYIIREIVLKDPNVPKAQGNGQPSAIRCLPVSPPQPFPAVVAQKIPALRSRRFFVTDQEVVIVDPKSNKVADIVKSQWLRERRTQRK